MSGDRFIEFNDVMGFVFLSGIRFIELGMVILKIGVIFDFVEYLLEK